MIVEIPDQLVDALVDALADRLAPKVVQIAVDRESPWMNKDEAIEYSRIPRGTFEKKVASGEIPSHGGRTQIFHRQELDRALGFIESPADGRPQPIPLRRAHAA